MAVSLVEVGTAKNTAGATLALAGVTVPAGALLVVMVAEASGASGAQSVSDGGTNTYTQATGVPNATNVLTNFWYVANCNALSGATLTYTKQNSGRDTVMMVFYVTGIITASPHDTAASTAGTFAATTTPSRTSGTPTQIGELFIGFVASQTTVASFTNDGTWTAPTNGFIQQNTAYLGWAWQVNAGTGTKTYAPTQGTSVAGFIGIETFKATPNTVVAGNLAMMGL